MNSGEDVDTVDYGKRFSTVRVAIDGAADDGAGTSAGKAENVRMDVEKVKSGKGNETIRGDEDANRLIGGVGNDTLAGLDGADVLDGGDGADSLDGGSGSDDLVGGTGRDKALYADRTLPVIVTIDGNRDDGEAGELDYVRTSVEDVVGGSAGDSLSGSVSGNSLWGGLGGDSLSGQGGADKLFGEDGDDALDGGPGNDQLDGGDGTDVCTNGETTTNCAP